MPADPFAFQGAKRRSYFEGWYCKNVAGNGIAFSFIPGLSYDTEGHGHSFVQVIRGSDGETAYLRYPREAFRASTRHFHVTVGENVFSFEGARIELPDAFGGITGELAFTDHRRLVHGLRQPRIMGWYRYVPFMECYHEVGSLSHRIDGTLSVAGETHTFDGGRGYLEKDWGTSMPTAWIWLQCNGFADPEASVMLSVARVPWLGNAFTGFLGFLGLPRSILKEPLRFGTYSGAKVTEINVDGTGVALEIDLGSRRLAIEARRTSAGFLSAPVAGAMDRRISESIDGTVSVRLNSLDGQTEWEGSGTAAGLELVGIIDSLMPGYR